MFATNTENFEKLKNEIFFKKTSSLYIVYSKCGHENEKIFEEEEPFEILKVIGLINDIEEYQKIYNNA